MPPDPLISEIARLPMDSHVHSEWSWDTPAEASMARSCEQALGLGVPAVSFTDHLDFTAWIGGDRIAEEGLSADRYRRMRPLDVEGYLAAIDDCRQRYPGLRILSGAEIGEAHLFNVSAKAVAGRASYDRILGSLHAVPLDGQLVAADYLFSHMPAAEVMRRYFAEVLRLIAGSDLFEVLAHLDFPRRMWPPSAGPYEEKAFEAEYRAILKALADSGRTLELNTKSPLASVELLGWWRDCGGMAISFGSDAHQPWRVGDKFKQAADIAEAAGFGPGRDPFDFWRRT
ncbi:MAG: PHP domain-containing protein [Streptosporangiaceae bacterium]|nr:PHP domain-containing protein [Streptosporangiaceae bacterium]